MATFDKEIIRKYGSLEAFAKADGCFRIYESDTGYHTVRKSADEQSILDSPYLKNLRIVWEQGQHNVDNPKDEPHTSDTSNAANELTKSFKIITHLASTLGLGFLLLIFFTPLLLHETTDTAFQFIFAWLLSVCIIGGVIFIYYALAGGLQWDNRGLSIYRLVAYWYLSAIGPGFIFWGYWLLVRYIMARIYNVPFNVTKGSLIKRQIKEKRSSQVRATNRGTYTRQTPSRSNTQQVQGILVLANNPLGNAQELLKQIIDQERSKGYSIIPNIKMTVGVTQSVDDKVYLYTRLMLEFPNLSQDDIVNKTLMFPFQASDGNSGNYFIVYSKPFTSIDKAPAQKNTLETKPGPERTHSGLYEIGIVFDIDDLGGGFYGWEAYKIFFSSLDPKKLTSCTIFDGDTRETLAGSARQYCIVIQSHDSSQVNYVKETISQRSDKGLLMLEKRFLEGNITSQQSLVRAGEIDNEGNLNIKKGSMIGAGWVKGTAWTVKIN
jgi:hypothetical protein